MKKIATLLCLLGVFVLTLVELRSCKSAAKQEDVKTPPPPANTKPASAKEEEKEKEEEKKDSNFTLILPTPKFKGWIKEVREEEEVVRYIWTDTPDMDYIPTPKNGHLSPNFNGSVIYDGLVYDKLAAEKTKTTVDKVSLQIKHSWGVYSVKNVFGKWDKITEEQFKTYARQFLAVRALSTGEDSLSGWIDVPLKSIF